MACICALRFEEDQAFSSLQGTTLETMSVVDGTWYVYLKGDYAGRVSGAVYDLRNSSDPVKLVTTVSVDTWLYRVMMRYWSSSRSGCMYDQGTAFEILDVPYRFGPLPGDCKG